LQPQPDFKGKNKNDSRYQKPTAKSWAMPRVVVKNKKLKNQKVRVPRSQSTSLQLIWIKKIDFCFEEPP
jgi:hypothetical protein